MIRVPIYQPAEPKPITPAVVPIFAGAIASESSPSQFALWVQRVGPLPLVENTIPND